MADRRRATPRNRCLGQPPLPRPGPQPGGDPPPPPPPPTARQQLGQAEQQLLSWQAQLEETALPGREQARLQAQIHQLRTRLYSLYGEAFSAAQWDDSVPEPPLVVRAQRLGSGGMFWAAHDPECPHLAWDGHTLRPSGEMPSWYGAALLAGALRILFLRWQVGRVQLGEGGPHLRRGDWWRQTGGG
ncbi:hypothetical protein ACFP81_10135 [Deinococcus lacus]|uniref:Uncharacterized protein n=1 Tax=Deinococcus lacus TaxID=392561 RepID=A0ABW1YDD3_9DEIO